ncbi:MAG: oxidoreductase [Sphingomonadales bacterium]|nr:oxidoreductase [Sphingomonadales bacterium]
MSQDEAPIQVRVIQKRLEADGIVSLQLRAVDGGALPVFAAGAHIDLILAPDLVRQYSLCPPLPEADVYEVAELREPESRGGSRAVHEGLQVGEVIEISQPRNHFPLKPGAGRTLLLAGGIGITPILAMAEEAAESGRSFEMHYCARSPARMAFQDRISRGRIGPHCAFHFDDGADEQKLDFAGLLASPAQEDQLYICGPGGFIEAVLGAALACGWSEAQLNREFFSAPAAQRGESDQAFTVVLGRSGKAVQVGVGVSIVEALEPVGVLIPTSCSEGICGMCVVSVLEGEPDHRDFVLGAQERASNNCLTACCSRAKSPVLVLDL